MGVALPPAHLHLHHHHLLLLCRNDILLLLDLKAACDACDFELQSLRSVFRGSRPALTPPPSSPPPPPGTATRPSPLHSRPKWPFLVHDLPSLSFPALPNSRPLLSSSAEVACHTPKRVRTAALCRGIFLMSLPSPQPLASGVQLLDVVSSSSGGSVSPGLASCPASLTEPHPLPRPPSLNPRPLQRKRRLATLESAVKKSRRS